LVRFLTDQAPNTDCVPLSLDVALGLEYLHGENIIHGDLKGFRHRGELASQILALPLQGIPNRQSGHICQRAGRQGHYDGKLLSYSSIRTLIRAPHSPLMSMPSQWYAMRCFLGHIPFTILRMILRSFWQYNRAKGRPHHHTT